MEIEQLKVLVKSQEYQINELINNKDQDPEMQKLKELLQAKTKRNRGVKSRRK